LRRDWRRRQEQCSDQREFLHVRPRFGGLITDQTIAYVPWPLSDQKLHHDAAYEAALRALNTAAYVRPFVLYFN
jgi:hypothetical protein